MDAKEEAKANPKILVSSRKGTKIELDRILPLEPTIFMTQRNADRRAIPTPKKKGLFKKLFGFLE